MKLPENLDILLCQFLSECEVVLLSQPNYISILQLENWPYLILPVATARWT